MNLWLLCGIYALNPQCQCDAQNAKCQLLLMVHSSCLYAAILISVYCRSHWVFTSGARGLTLNQKNHLNIHTSFMWSDCFCESGHVEKFNLSLFADCVRNSESWRGFLFLSPKGMCAADISLSCLIHLDWSRWLQLLCIKWCDHGLAGKAA